MLLYWFCYALFCIGGQFTNVIAWGFVFGVAIIQRVFCVMSLRGLYLERLIHGWAYFRNLTVQAFNSDNYFVTSCVLTYRGFQLSKCCEHHCWSSQKQNKNKE